VWGSPSSSPKVAISASSARRAVGDSGSARSATRRSLPKCATCFETAGSADDRRAEGVGRARTRACSVPGLPTTRRALGVLRVDTLTDGRMFVPSRLDSKLFNAARDAFVTSVIKKTVRPPSPSPTGARRGRARLDRVAVGGDIGKAGLSGSGWIQRIAAIPANRAYDHLGDAPVAAPAKLAGSLRAREAQDSCLGRGVQRGLRVPATAAPAVHQPIDHASDRLTVGLIGPEVPRAAEVGRARPEQVRCECEVASQRFEDVLPGADGVRVAYRYPPTAQQA